MDAQEAADYGLVELVFDMKNSGIADKMSELDIPIEDGQVILSRKIMKNRSICKVNGETVTMATVRELAGELLDIHGQHEHQSLLCKHKHLEILDVFISLSMEYVRMGRRKTPSSHIMLF